MFNRSILASYEYDALGYITATTDANNHSTTYVNDGKGDRLSESTTVTLADGSVKAVTTQWDYDDEGRLNFTINAEGEKTEYRYDANGQQVAMIDTLLRETRYRYDNKGQLVETIYPDATPEVLTDNPRTVTLYDRGSRSRASIDESGRVTHFFYDVEGDRPVERLGNQGDR